MPSPPAYAPFNPKDIPFPSDNILLGRMRKEEPRLFAEPALIGDPGHVASVFATLSLEIQQAERAFRVARGEGDPYPEQERRQILVVLNDSYERYGISSGMKETEELVRRFESRARELAKLGCTRS